MMVIAYRTLIEVIEFSQPKGDKLKTRELKSKEWCKLARGVNAVSAVRPQRPELLDLNCTPVH